MIISKGYFESHGEERFSKEPSGTGPFKFKQWDREAGKVYLERTLIIGVEKQTLKYWNFMQFPRFRSNSGID